MSKVRTDFRPRNEAELVHALGDPLWRLSNLYHIMVKGDNPHDEGRVILFRPNRAQAQLLERLHYRNLVLKARQLGFTTLIDILFLDYTLFGPGHTRAGIIADTDPNAEVIFRDKIRFAYDRLPDALREAMPLQRDSSRELLFGHNNSSIRVGTSMRSGTIHYLHVSEFGKICARFPHRAVEVTTGSLPAVPSNGIVFIESTAEGRDGAFYDMTQRARAAHDAGKKLSTKEYRFHFFPWFDEPGYQCDPAGIIITDKDHDYFDAIEAQTGAIISIRQRAWYCMTRDNDLHGDQQKMWQEFPSTPDEAFQVSSEGAYYTNQMTQARKQGRIREILPVIDGAPCWTFWDIGNSDGTAIWVVQHVHPEFRIIRFYEAWGEPYSHATNWLQSLGLTFACHYLPHDADHVRQGQSANKSPRQMLGELMPGARIEVVPRVQDVNWGIQQTRDIFPSLWFDEGNTKAGLAHIENYRKRWSERQGAWSDQPDKAGGHSEAADALRQLAQAYHGGMLNIHQRKPSKRAESNWRVV